MQEEIRNTPSNIVMNQHHQINPDDSMLPVRDIDDLPKPPVAKRRKIDHTHYYYYSS